MELKLTAVFEQAPEGSIGYVEELPGATTHAPSTKPAPACKKRSRSFSTPTACWPKNASAVATSSASLFASRLEVWRENQSDGARDHAVIDAWAELLGVSGWYARLTDEGDDSRESER